MRIFHGIAQLLTLEGAVARDGRRVTESDLGIIANAAVVVGDDLKIAWLGKLSDLPASFSGERIDAGGAIWFPALVECHTHLVFDGTRFVDYANRCAGQTYQQVAAASGGILSTINHTRKASPDRLLANAREELARFRAFGVGAVEIKSGYGLSLDSEIRILECIAALQRESEIPIVSTFMPAHATPPEFKGRTDEYVDVICREWIPEIARRKLAEFLDTFVEEGYFSKPQAEKLAATAKDHGLKNKLHVEQFTDLGSTALAVDIGATSCDHLDHVSDKNIEKLAQSNTVAVLLPGASLFTATPYPPARKLVDAGSRVALSTDYNPGTCPSRNLGLMATLACSQMKMTVPEAIVALTFNAALALGLEHRLGSFAVGKEFRVTELRETCYEAFAYRFGESNVRNRT